MGTYLNKKNMISTGFTIVELLIVIVVIGILAAITLVAYNGIQSRANTTAATMTANSVEKKAEAYNAINSTYPTTVTGATGFDNNTESKLTGSGSGLNPTINAANGKNVVNYQVCTTGLTGARIQYWDFTANAVSSAANSYYLGGVTAANVATCTVWATGLTLAP